MPTLQRRQDGGYFVRNHYGDHHTWQLLADGLRFLQFRGIEEGAWFTTDLFMQLYMQGWVYTGSERRLRPRDRALALGIPKELESRLQTFHRALFAGDVAQVVTALWFAQAAQEGEAAMRQQLAHGPKLLSWKLKDAVVYELADEARAELGGARHLAAVCVRLGFSGAPATEVKEHWLDADSQWRIGWGFLPT